MVFQALKKLFNKKITRNPVAQPLPPKYRPRMESLEERVTPAQVVTDLTTLAPTALVQNLVGPGVAFSNVKYTGAKAAAGNFTFSDGPQSVGFGAGVVLSSGNAKAVVGPNKSGQTSTAFSTPGDADLTKLAGTVTNDASVLEFDFVPQGNIVSFKFVFGSDEYTEFIGINDVFGFFLNGKNVALIPGTSTPISINNVNPTTNPKYYINNEVAPFSRNIEFDGLTKVFDLVLPVTAGKSNHIKMAVADAGDTIIDSGVFIEAGSFSAPKIVTQNPFRYVYKAATQTYEGYISLTNIGSGSLDGPVLITFTHLPPGVTLANASGVNSKGVPFLRLNGGIPAHSSAKIYVKFLNPFHQPLNTYYLGSNIQFTNVLN